MNTCEGERKSQKKRQMEICCRFSSKLRLTGLDDRVVCTLPLSREHNMVCSHDKKYNGDRRNFLVRVRCLVVHHLMQNENAFSLL